MTPCLRCTLLLCAAAFAGCTSIERLAIPNARTIEADWTASAGAADVSHLAFSEFLARYATSDGDGVVRIAYGAVSGADATTLNAYLDTLQAVDPSTLTREGQLAYWINLYNAKTVSVILEHYPVRSIRAIRIHPIDPGPWDEARLYVTGRPLSLHDIEHGVLRPNWPEAPEIHYLLNCAAVGCPNLGLAAYTAENVGDALEQGARRYVNDPRGVALQDDGKLRVSKIYAWYREDFGGSDAAVLDHLRRYAEPALRSRLAESTRIDGYVYDWALNDASDVR